MKEEPRLREKNKKKELAINLLSFYGRLAPNNRWEAEKNVFTYSPIMAKHKGATVQ